MGKIYFLSLQTLLLFFPTFYLKFVLKRTEI